MINAREYSCHNSYTGISAKDELFVAELIYRQTGIPLAKNPNIFGIDLVSIDPDRKLVVEVEGTSPGVWRNDELRPKRWREASFVAKKLGNFIVSEGKGVPSAYIKINHYYSSCYYVDGHSLLARLKENGGAVSRVNINMSMNGGEFICFDWDDNRLSTGFNKIRENFWGLMKVYGQRKTKARRRKHYLVPEEAYKEYLSIQCKPQLLEIHDSTPLSFMESRWWMDSDMVEVRRWQLNKEG